MTRFFLFGSMTAMNIKKIGVTLLISFLLLGAVKEEEDAIGGDGTPPGASVSEEEGEKPPLQNSVKPPEGEAGANTEADTGEEEDSREDTPKQVETPSPQIGGQLSYQRLSPALLPEDFEIGPLAGGPEQEPILTPIRRLLQGLGEDRIEETLLVPELKSSIVRVLEDFPDGDLTYRLGKVNFLADGYASVNCRIYRPIEGGERAAAAGEFHLEYFGETWLIAAVDFDYQDLLQPYLERADPFEPQSYRWLELY